MMYSDTTQEHYRQLKSRELARTKVAIEKNWSRYTRYSDMSEEEAMATIDDDLCSADLAYAWACRMGTLTESALDFKIEMANAGC